MAEVTSFTLAGRVEERYIFRTTDGGKEQENDQDVYSSLTFRAEYGRWALDFSGTLATDIDGLHDGPFSHVNSSYGKNRAYLYRAFLEGKDLGPIERARLGRQVHSQGMEVYRFDGMRAETEEWKGLSFDLFGGVPAHLYERYGAGDWLSGADLTYRLTPGTELRVGYAHIVDRLRNIHGRRQNRYDLTASHRQSWGGVRVDAATIDGRASETRLLATLDLAATGTHLQFTYLGRFGSWRRLTTELSAFDEVSIRYEDFVQFELQGRQFLGQALALDASVKHRELLHDKDEGPFNHEFLHATGGLSVIDVPFDGLTASVYAIAWLSDDDDLVSWGGSLAYATAARELRFEAGTDFSLYHVDRWTANERTRVRTVHVKVAWEPFTRVRLQVRAQSEWTDYETYFTADVRVVLTF